MNLERRAFDGTGKLVFRLSRRQILETGDEQCGVLAMDDRERAGPSLLPVFVRNDGAVPTGVVELHRNPARPLHLDAVDRGVDPSAVGIAHDDDRARADEWTAIVPVPYGSRKLPEID